MNAMTAPMQPSTTPAPAPSNAAAPNTVATTSPEVTSGDFLLMLGQLLGAPVAQSAGTAKNPATLNQDGDAAEQAVEDAVAMTGLPLSVTTHLPQNQLSQAGGAKSPELLPVITDGSGSRSAAQAKSADLAMTLMDTLSRSDANASTSSLNAQSSTPTDAMQQLRPGLVVDSGPTRTLHHPVGSSAWGDELGTRMILMSERGQHSASLRMSPEHLGPLEVRISVRDDQASVWFGAAHADTRAAIEQALPRLRELFASQGLSLADAGVHHEAPREQAHSPAPSASSMAAASAEAEAAASPIAVRLGLLDAYA